MLLMNTNKYRSPLLLSAAAEIGESESWMFNRRVCGTGEANRQARLRPIRKADSTHECTFAWKTKGVTVPPYAGRRGREREREWTRWEACKYCIYEVQESVDEWGTWMVSLLLLYSKYKEPLTQWGIQYEDLVLFLWWFQYSQWGEQREDNLRLSVLPVYFNDDHYSSSLVNALSASALLKLCGTKLQFVKVHSSLKRPNRWMIQIDFKTLLDQE